MIHPLIKNMGKYKAVQCPECGFIQGISADQVWKCFKCKKIVKLICKATKNNPTSLNCKVLFHSSNPSEASNYIKQLKQIKHERTSGKKIHGTLEDFFSYSGVRK